MLLFAMSWSLNSCSTTILYWWKFGSSCKILLTLRLDIPRATEYLLAQQLGLLMNDCLRALVFCGDRTARTLTGGFFLNMEALVLKCSVHNCIVLGQGTFSWWEIVKCLRNIHCGSTTESPFLKKTVSTINTLPCALHCSMATATTTAASVKIS
jgi:hypothetical protein